MTSERATSIVEENKGKIVILQDLKLIFFNKLANRPGKMQTQKVLVTSESEAAVIKAKQSL